MSATDRRKNCIQSSSLTPRSLPTPPKLELHAHRSDGASFAALQPNNKHSTVALRRPCPSYRKTYRSPLPLRCYSDTFSPCVVRSRLLQRHMWKLGRRRLLVAGRRNSEARKVNDTLFSFFSSSSFSSYCSSCYNGRNLPRGRRDFSQAVLASGATPPSVGSANTTRNLRHSSFFSQSFSLSASSATVTASSSSFTSISSPCYQTRLHSNTKSISTINAVESSKPLAFYNTKLPSSAPYSGRNTAEVQFSCKNNTYNSLLHNRNTTTSKMDSMPAISLPALSLPNFIGLKPSTPEDDDSGKTQHLENTGIISSIVQATSDFHLPQGISETETEKENKWYIGSIDCGTTSSRFLIFDGSGNPTASHQIEFENIYPESG